MGAQFLENLMDDEYSGVETETDDWGMPKSEVIVVGGPDDYPTQGDNPEYPQDSGFSFKAIKDVIGNLSSIARDVGSAVGTAQRQIKQAPIVYNQARTNAASGNAIGQWWQYSSQTDKIMVGLAVVGIIVALRNN